MLHLENFTHVTLSHFDFSDNQEHKLWENNIFRHPPLPLPLPPTNNVGKMDETDLQHCSGGRGVQNGSFLEFPNIFAPDCLNF